MKRLAPLALVLFAALACPRDKTDRAESIPEDTTKTDLSQVRSAIPPAAPDTFGPRKLAAPKTADRGGDVETSLPTAPPELLATVEREEGFSRFCFTEFGKKSDPSLRGNVTMAVTVGDTGVSEAKVASSNWSGAAGGAVDRCLNERAERAWKVNPGLVKPGRYAVRLSFSG